MKTFILVSALLAVARAGVVVPAIVAPAPLLPHSTQYHSQDATGQYAYGYANEQSAKNEVKFADGQTVGSYSYVDPEGKLQNVQYRSDALHGFRVAATNVPVGPSPIEVPVLPLPEPVRDVPEVVEARAKHLEALRQAEEDAKKSIIEVKAAVITAPTPAVEVARAAPILAAPSFGYSFGISHGGLYSFSLHPQPIVTSYAALGHLIAAPIAAEALPEPTKEAEVVEAKTKTAEPQETPKEPQQEAKE